LTPPGDAQALQSAIRYLLDHPLERERMGQAAKLRSEDYKASRVIRQIEHVYTTLLNKKKSFKRARVLDDPETIEE
jgi:glycosyltransferase involved in cell wall biosynthesis